MIAFVKRAALAVVAACLCVLALPGVGMAACTPTGNTTGTDSAAIVANTYVNCNGGVTTPATAYSANVTNTAVAANAAATKMRSYTVFNTNSSVCYLQFFDVAQGSVTVGTTAPKFSIGIPALGGANASISFTFATALTLAATTARANGSACTNGLDVNILQD